VLHPADGWRNNPTLPLRRQHQICIRESSITINCFKNQKEKKRKGEEKRQSKAHRFRRSLGC
ncbi:hypothetical protein, partial [Pseudomonas carnis]|uniref:hypothetical protein n=1 Tax=Pseudomonas carnis TaxID=2487355 RepID=UPI001F2C1B26